VTEQHPDGRKGIGEVEEIGHVAGHRQGLFRRPALERLENVEIPAEALRQGLQVSGGARPSVQNRESGSLGTVFPHLHGP
jgi:hypothetical protein